LKNGQSFSHSRTSQHFIVLVSSLPCSQKYSTGPGAEENYSSPYHPISSKIHCNIILPLTSRSS
jgi:hypothetical protein